MNRALKLASAGTIAAAIVAGAALCSPAQATPTAFSFNYTYGGSTGQTYSISGPGTYLSNAITVTEGTGQMILTVDDVFGPPAGAVGETITYSDIPLVVPVGASGALASGMTVTWDNGMYSFTSTSGSYTRVPAQDALDFSWIGTFTDSSGVLDTQGATLSQTWSQAAPGIQPSTGGTFNTNPTIVIPTIPEPGAMALLATGLLGLVAIRRQRRNAA
jgi:hypothetical protein